MFERCEQAFNRQSEVNADIYERIHNPDNRSHEKILIILNKTLNLIHLRLNSQPIKTIKLHKSLTNRSDNIATTFHIISTFVKVRESQLCEYLNIQLYKIGRVEIESDEKLE